ncbi:MAG: hypothetical protein R3E10_08515 [Gemmatimonadota bacterium]
MARLIVSAVSRESTGDSWHRLLLYASVSRADDGSPVTGLTKANFRITSNISLVVDPAVWSVHETMWEPGDAIPSGCYLLDIGRTEGWGAGHNYTFGIQVRTFDGSGRGAQVVDQGQAAVSVISTGV